MPVPILAAIGTGARLLGGAIVKGVQRINERRVARGRGKLFSGVGRFFGRIFRSRRNKSQRLQASANRVFARKVQRAARQNRLNRQRFEKQLRKAGGNPAAFWAKQEAPGLPVVKPKPGIVRGLQNAFRNFVRAPQEFQAGQMSVDNMPLPPAVRQQLKDQMPDQGGNKILPILAGIGLLAFVLLNKKK